MRIALKIIPEEKGDLPDRLRGFLAPVASYLDRSRAVPPLNRPFQGAAIEKEKFFLLESQCSLFCARRNGKRAGLSAREIEAGSSERELRERRIRDRDGCQQMRTH